MDDIIFRISRSYLTGITGLIGLAGVTWAIRRYLSNTRATTNSHYVKQDELGNTSSITAITPARDKIYIFWDGSVNSTYLIINYLLQDKVIQPLYIESYTIRKSLEHEHLEKCTSLYNKDKDKCDSRIIKYLTDVARMKKTQNKDLQQISTMRRVILNQYPEFANNFLATQYITIIEKDLSFSQDFYDILRNMQLSTIKYSGIELFEQASRYISHMQGIDSNTKIIMGYSSDSSLTPIILQILAKWIHDKTNTSSTSSTSSKNKIIIGLPLARINNETIKYIAGDIINKEVMRFLYNS